MIDTYELIDLSIDDIAYEYANYYIEGKYVQNVPKKEAKKNKLYGKDKLTDEEKDRRSKKRIGTTMRGSIYGAMRKYGEDKYGSISADPEKDKKYRGKRFKMTAKDVMTHPKDVVKGIGNMIKDQTKGQVKRMAVTQSSIPGINPVALTPLAPLSSIDTGAVLPLGPGTNANRAKALERLSRIDKERDSEIRKNGKVDPIKEKIRNTKGRITVNRAIEFLPQTKDIENRFTVDIGKAGLGRSINNKDLSNVKSAVKTVGSGLKNLKQKAKEMKNNKDDLDKIKDDSTMKNINNFIKRDTVNAPSGYKDSIKDYAKTIGHSVSNDVLNTVYKIKNLRKKKYSMT